jgi:hypothetical protein
MSEQPRRRLRPNPVPRRAAEPNTLSNQATPNVLSTMGTPGRGASPTAAPGPAPRQAPRPAPVTAATRSTPTGDARFERPARRVRGPSLGAIIFIGILLINAARFFGIGGSGSAATTEPRPPTAAPAATLAYGAVTFGSSHGADCALQSTARSFSPGVDVFWRADLLTVQGANAAIIVVTFKDAKQIDYEYVPPEPSVGEWQVFCAGPAKDELAGTYRIEVWNADRSKLLARGEFLRLGASATPAATGTPAGASASP